MKPFRRRVRVPALTLDQINPRVTVNGHPMVIIGWSRTFDSLHGNLTLELVDEDTFDRRRR